MPHAYTAKPAAEVTPTPVPTGWNPPWWPSDEEPAWTFPGPSPPGYEPEYSAVITCVDTVSPGDSLTVTVKLYDHTTYATTTPRSGSFVIWSATLDGESVGIRLAGGSSYSSSLMSTHASLSGFWGASVELEANLESEDVGKTLVIRATSDAFGGAVVDTHSVDVEIPRTAALTITPTVTPSAGGEYAFLALSIVPNGAAASRQASVSYEQNDGSVTVGSFPNTDETGFTVEWSVDHWVVAIDLVNCAENGESSVLVTLAIGVVTDASARLDASVTVTIGGVAGATRTEFLTGTEVEKNISIDTTTGDITVS